MRRPYLNHGQRRRLFLAVAWPVGVAVVYFGVVGVAFAAGAEGVDPWVWGILSFPLGALLVLVGLAIADVVEWIRAG